jgi:hypothetical protein
VRFVSAGAERGVARQVGSDEAGGVHVALLWALVLLLVIFAIVGGAAFNHWLFLIVVIAVILALAGAF